MARKKAAGRPTKYDAALAEEICARLMLGESLRRICDDDDMPARRTVVYWLAGRGLDEETHLTFVRQYACAREVQAELYADDIVDIADDDTEDVLFTDDGPVPNTARIQRDRIRIDSRKWVVVKLLPRFAEKLTLNGGDAPIRYENVTNEELAKRVAMMLAAADAKKKRKAGT